MRVVAGRRPRPDAADRSRRLLAANKRELGQAELMAGIIHRGIIHRGVEHHTDPLPEAKQAWHAFMTGEFPWSDATLRAAVAALTALADTYNETGSIELTWPARLAGPVPPATPQHPRGARGRV